MAGWHYLRDGTQHGPITDEDLLAKVAASEITVDDLVWSDGMADWVPAGDVVEFEDAAPPAATEASSKLSETGKAPDLSAEEWHATIGGEQQGPYSFQGLGALYKDRTLSKDDLVWSQSLGDWTAAGEVDALIPFKPVGLAAPPRTTTPPASAKTKTKASGGKKKRISVKKKKISTSPKSKVSGITRSGESPSNTPVKRPAGKKIASRPAGNRPPASSPASRPAAAAAEPYAPPKADLQANRGVGNQVGGDIIRELEGTQGWVRFMSVLTYIPGILMLVAAGFAVIMSIVGLVKGGIGPALMGLFAAVIYGGLGALMLYPARKLWGYASSIQRLRATREHRDLREAITMQRQYWKFMGILTIVYLCLSFGMLLLSLIAPALLVNWFRP